MTDLNGDQNILQDKQGWDSYWGKQQKRILYDLIAEFYRRVLIRPSLNRFLRRNFPKESSLLHAGCGSGQVDKDIHSEFQITALDISQNALAIYRDENGQDAKTLHGSIFSIPAEDATFDGVYNLGVMEHFEEEEISKILCEFKRVLKPNGKFVAFWPPEFGVSVIFFKVLRSFLKLLTGKTYKFHPDEVSRLQSKKHAERLFNEAGFSVEDFSFGPRDAFTYAVVTVTKTPTS